VGWRMPLPVLHFQGWRWNLKAVALVGPSVPSTPPPSRMVPDVVHLGGGVGDLVWVRWSKTEYEPLFRVGGGRFMKVPHCR
jgi:hypothetical protein